LPNDIDAVTDPGPIAALQAGGHAVRTREPDPHADAIDGILPRIVVEAESRAAVAAVLRWAGEHSLPLVIRGGGTKLGWGAVPAPFHVLLDVSRLNRVLDHRSGDLTVSVEAGARLRDVNELLRQRGQWLALDPPFAEAATIGGLLATNDSGPARHRFGTPRDLVIGIEIATMDGKIAKAGGQVVKNVAGYDLSKIMSGSFGSLGAIVAATFKLAPVAAASATVLIPHLDSDAAVRVVEAIAASQLEPVAFELDVHATRAPGGGTLEIACMLRFASVAAAVDAETANASGRIATVHPAFRVLTGDGERGFWRGYGRRPWAEPGTIVRASWLPGSLAEMLSAVRALSAEAALEITGRLATGSGLFRIDAHREAQREVVARMRSSAVFGNVVVLRAPSDLRTRDWVWGSPGAPPVAAALKRELDPAGLLGAGRGPL
jgi:glycolate oxidase FAD binding subunit